LACSVQLEEGPQVRVTVADPKRSMLCNLAHHHNMVATFARPTSNQQTTRPDWDYAVSEQMPAVPTLGNNYVVGALTRIGSYPSGDLLKVVAPYSGTNVTFGGSDSVVSSRDGDVLVRPLQQYSAKTVRADSRILVAVISGGAASISTVPCVYGEVAILLKFALN
ncbi:hypothetical protein BaRGS_00027944, partial [Batillaria attramentaria]